MRHHTTGTTPMPLFPAPLPATTVHVEGFTRGHRVRWKDKLGQPRTGHVIAAIGCRKELVVRDDQPRFGIVHLTPALTLVERI